MYDHNKYGCEDIFQNEIGIFLEYMINQNLKVYYVKSSPNHNIEYNQECFNFFKNFKIDPENTVMPKNIKNLRELQSNDLIYFYDNLILESFFVISKIKNKKYFYDMLIVVKNNFNINDFYKINFNTIKIESITPIFYENITYNYMQQIFNFDELNSYFFCNTLDNLFNKFLKNVNHNFDYKELQEYKDLQKYEFEQIKIKKNFNYQHNDPLF